MIKALRGLLVDNAPYNYYFASRRFLFATLADIIDKLSVSYQEIGCFDMNQVITSLTCGAILFDLDGTLIDSAASIEFALRVWCAEHNLDVKDFMHKAQGRRTIDSIRLLTPQLDALREAQKLEDLECSAVDGLVAFNGAHEIINTLPTDCWAVVTSGGHRLASRRLSYAGIKIPEVFITAEDVQEGKPHPEGYMKAADALGINYANCLVIEDAPAGIQAARAAGMKVIAVATTHSARELTDANYCIDALSRIKIAVGSSLQITIS